ncbi:MAG: ABC transporter ATP-binding protein [Actinomycetota bacterium]
MTTTTENQRRTVDSGPASEVVVRVAGVQKIFDSSRGRHEALKSIDLDIFDGEFLTILGPSGCGKTTLLRVLAGFEQPTRGDVLLDGAVITEVPPNHRPMAMVFQSYALFPHLTVHDNIAYGLKIAKVPKAEIAERIEVVLSIMDLVGLGDRLPTQLSGGQQQRVALARSVVVRPRVLLFDEPLSNLDARLRDQMRSELRRIQRQLGVTSVYVTHDQTEAMAMSDRIVVMSEGHIEQVGTPEQIYRRPDSLFVADFIGKANVLPAPVLPGGVTDRAADRVTEGRGPTGEVELFGVTLPLELSDDVGDTATLVLRPEDVLITPFDSPNDHSPVLVDGRIEAAGWLRASEYVGGATHLTFELLDGTLLESIEYHTAAAGPAALPTEGAGVLASFPTAALRSVERRR